MSKVIDAVASSFAEPFARLEKLASTLFSEKRKESFAAFERTGIPSTRNEEWKYTDLRALQSWSPKYANEGAEATGALSAEALPASVEDALIAALAELSEESDEATNTALRLVFIDGLFAPTYSGVGENSEWFTDARDLTEKTGAFVSPLSMAKDQLTGIVTQHLGTTGPSCDLPLAALSTAMHQDGGFVYIPRGKTLDRAIHIVHVASGQVDVANTSHPRNLVILEESSSGCVLEDFVSLGEAEAFTNPMTELSLGENANLDHYRFVRENEHTHHIATTFAALQANAQLVASNVSRGGKLVRNDLRVALNGSGASCTLNGLNIGHGEQVMDDHTSVIHAVPHCFSREFYRSVLDDKAQGVFNGKVLVHQDAQKTDGVQENKGLLLSEKASMNTKPQLEIFADDVKCTHGATIGQLDRDALFYLRSRGLGAVESRKILVRAFAHDIVNRMSYAPAQRLAEALLDTAVVLP